jgi:hypothetical protein
MPQDKSNKDDAVAISPYRQYSDGSAKTVTVPAGDQKTGTVTYTTGGTKKEAEKSGGQGGTADSPNTAANTAARNAALGNPPSGGGNKATSAAAAPAAAAAAPSHIMQLSGLAYLSSPEEFNAYANTLDSWSRYLSIVNSQSQYVMTVDKIGPDGIPTFKQMLGPDNQPIPQSQYALNMQQIDRLKNQDIIDMANTSGKIKDPETGKWIQTPDAIVKMAQSDQYKQQAELTKQEALKTIAETAYISGAQTDLTRNQSNLVTAQTTYTNEQQKELARRYELDRQNALAQAVADPRRSVEAAMMMQLYGANQGGMPVGTSGYSAQGMAQQAPQYTQQPPQYMPAQGFAGGTQAQVAQPVNSGPPAQAPAWAWAGGQDQGGMTRAAVMPQDQGGMVRAAVLPNNYYANLSPEYIAYQQKKREFVQQMKSAGKSPEEISSAFAQQFPASQDDISVMGTSPMPQDQIPSQFMRQGWPSATGQVSSTDAANGVGGYSAGQLAQNRQNTAYVVNPNLAAALQGQYVPGAGNKSGSYGQVTTIAGAAPRGGNYGKINPVSYRNMDEDTRARYGSLALANQGMSEQDLAKRQRVALPGASASGGGTRL